MTIQGFDGQPAVLNQPVVSAAAWTADDLATDQSWIHPLTEPEVTELDAAVRAIEDRSLGILDITKDDFAVPALGKRLAAIHHDLIAVSL